MAQGRRMPHRKMSMRKRWSTMTEIDYEYLAELEEANEDQMHWTLYAERKEKESKRMNKVRE